MISQTRFIVPLKILGSKLILTTKLKICKFKKVDRWRTMKKKAQEKTHNKNNTTNPNNNRDNYAKLFVAFCENWPRNEAHAYFTNPEHHMG